MQGLIEKLNKRTVFNIRNFGFLLFLLPPSLLLCAYLGGEHFNQKNLWAYFPLLFTYGIIPICDYIIGRDTYNPDPSQTKQLNNSFYFPLLTLLCVPLQLACLYWAAQYSINSYLMGQLTEIGFFGWIISTGIASSVLAINVGHELVHKNSKLEQWAGGFLYASVCYAGFKVEHIRGHHVHVSTPLDASSARFNANPYQFIPQAIFKNTYNAFRLEAKRLQSKGLPATHWRNELLWWYSISLILIATATFLFGPLGLVFFLIQSLIAVIHLELINFVEHYGLHRRLLENGHYERPSIKHSWNSSYLLTNLILFHLQRHSDHHENPKQRYQVLRHFDESPQLPGGYASMVLLALIPPLWKRIINPRVIAYYKGEEEQLT